MVIQCTECQTRFRLADEKVKPQGTKVRCSKCHNIFIATPPQTEPAAVPEPVSPPPFSTEPEAPLEQESTASATQDSSRPGPFESPFADDEETTAEDFFSESDADPGAFSFEDQTDSDFDWSGDVDGELPDDFDLDSEMKEAGNFDFGSIGLDDSEAKPPELPVEEKEEEVVVPQPPTPKTEPATPPRGSKVRVQPPRRKSPMRGVAILLGVLLIILAALAGYFYLQGGKVNYMQIFDKLTGQASSTAVPGHITLGGLSGAFATNREVGQVFVIRGQATNNFPESRSAIAVKGMLYNKEGKPLLQQTVFCGNPLSAGDIEDLPYVKIEETMNNQFGDSLSNLNVAPHKAIPFTIVFKKLPNDVAEFTVEVVDSKPGAKQ